MVDALNVALDPERRLCVLPCHRGINVPRLVMAVVLTSISARQCPSPAPYSRQAATVLCTCVFEGNMPLLKRYLVAGVPIDEGDYDLRTALHIAAAEGNLTAVRCPDPQHQGKPLTDLHFDPSPLAWPATQQQRRPQTHLLQYRRTRRLQC